MKHALIAAVFALLCAGGCSEPASKPGDPAQDAQNALVMQLGDMSRKVVPGCWYVRDGSDLFYNHTKAAFTLYGVRIVLTERLRIGMFEGEKWQHARILLRIPGDLYCSDYWMSSKKYNPATGKMAEE